MEIYGQRKYPGTYTVNKGTTIGLNAMAENTGSTGQCRIFCKDENSGKILADMQYYVKTGGKYGYYRYATVNSDLKLRVYAAYWDGSRWVITDQYGDWVIDVGAIPVPRIVEPSTYIIIKGKTKPPGTYNVSKGEVVGIVATITNAGGTGKCRVFVKDKNTGNILADAQKELKNKEKLRVSKNVTVNSDMDLVAYAAYWDGSKWVVTDSYG